MLSEGYIEVKGWFGKRDQAKMQMVQEQHPDFFDKIRFIRLDDMKILRELYKKDIPNWESKF